MWILLQLMNCCNILNLMQIHVIEYNLKENECEKFL